MVDLFTRDLALGGLVPRGFFLLSAHLGLDGNPLLFCVPEGRVSEVLALGGSSTRGPMKTPYEARVVGVGDCQDPRTAALLGTSFAAPLVEPLPGDRLLVCSTSGWAGTNGEPEPNAAVYDLGSEQRVATFSVGHGVSQLASTEGGEFYVGYGEEGIARASVEPEWPGAEGLLRFRQDGQISYRYQSSGVVPAIEDCCALNVSDAGAFVYSYGSHCLVRLGEQGNSPKVWETGVEGAHAVAVAGPFAALFGCHDDPLRLTLLRLGEACAVDVVHEFSLAADPSAKVLARGSRFALVTLTRWQSADLGTLLAAAGIGPSFG
jgi:hypothetical protein